MAGELLSDVPDQSLTILDRNFLSPLTLLPLQRGGAQRHWLIRTKKNMKWRVAERLGRNDFIVEMEVTRTARIRDETLPQTWAARSIRYERKGFPPQFLLTSLIDAERYPASEIVATYHERWEIELRYDEIKTEVLAREEAIRSKSSITVAQEPPRTYPRAVKVKMSSYLLKRPIRARGRLVK